MNDKFRPGPGWSLSKFGGDHFYFNISRRLNFKNDHEMKMIKYLNDEIACTFVEITMYL